MRSNTADAHESKRGEQADVCSPLPSPPGATRESRQRRAETIAGSSHEVGTRDPFRRLISPYSVNNVVCVLG